MFRKILLSIVLVLLLVAPVAAKTAVPFKGSFAGQTISQQPTSTPGVFALVVAGTGQATHLGSYSLEIPHTFNFATLTAEGKYIFTAANGDELTADFIGLGSFSSPTTLNLAVTATITGGTGRFATASGDFTVDVVVDLTDGSASGEFNGLLSK